MSVVWPLNGVASVRADERSPSDKGPSGNAEACLIAQPTCEGTSAVRLASSALGHWACLLGCSDRYGAKPQYRREETLYESLYGERADRFLVRTGTL